MLNALALGAVSQLSLVLSGLAVFIVSVPRRVIGAMAGSGAGARIAAVSRDLLPEAHVLRIVQAAMWVFPGALAFIVGEHFVEKKFGAFVAAVFVSNIPQAIAPSADLAESGWSFRRVAALWTWVVLACGVASLAGYGAGRTTSAVSGSRMSAFAAGGILAMLSNSLIPSPTSAPRRPGCGPSWGSALPSR